MSTLLVISLCERSNRDSIFEEYQKGSSETSYSCDELSILALSILYELSKDDVYFKQCKHCGKWFIPTTAKEQYCSRLINGKTCKEASKAQRRKERGLTELQKKYNSVRTSLCNQKNKKDLTAEEKRAIDEEVRAFSDEASEIRAKIKRGEVSETTYSEWLDSKKIRSKKKNCNSTETR